MKRKVEAWALLEDDGSIGSLHSVRGAGRMEKHWPRMVHLVPADPDRDAVVKAAVAWAKCGSGRRGIILIRAVERMQRKERKP